MADERPPYYLERPDAPPPSFGQVAQSGILPEVRQAQTEYQEAQKRRAERVGTRIAEEKQAITAVPHEAPPAAETLPKPPSVGLTPFLAPVEGERPENTIAKLIQGVGLLATGVAGRKDARASLAALTGALKGWQEGDKERADRHFADWQAQSETMLKNWQTKRTRWKDLQEDLHLTAQQRAKVLELDLLKEGFPVDVAKANLEGATYLQDVMLKMQAHADSVETNRLNLNRMYEFAEASRKQQDKQLQEHEAIRQKETAPKQYYDKQSGRIISLTKGEIESDLKAVQEKARPEPRYTELSEQRQAQLERLALAPPMLDQLDTLVDRITKAAPGENITQGLINRLKYSAGIGKDIQQFVTLNLDTLVELTGALSGGTPRIAILRMLRGEAQPRDSMTTEVAHIAVDTMRTTIQNRVALYTDDPDAVNKLSRNLKRYDQSDRIRITGPMGPDGHPQIGTVPRGTDLSKYPGWREVK